MSEIAENWLNKFKQRRKSPHHNIFSSQYLIKVKKVSRFEDTTNIIRKYRRANLIRYNAFTAKYICRMIYRGTCQKERCCDLPHNGRMFPKHIKPSKKGIARFDPMLSSSIIRANDTELLEFYNKHRSFIKRLVFGETNNDNKTNNQHLRRHKKDAFFLIKTLCGDRFTGLDVYLCFYLFFNLGSEHKSERFYNDEQYHPRQIKNNICHRILSLHDRKLLDSWLSYAKSSLIPKGPHNYDICYNITQKVNNFISKSLIADRDLFLTKGRLNEFYRKLRVLANIYYNENGIVP